MGRPIGTSKLLQPSGIHEDNVELSYFDAIIRKMETSGLRATMCAETVGLPRNTVSIWLNTGRKLRPKAMRGDPTLTRMDKLLVRFFNETREAHSRWISNTVEIHRQIAAGGLTTAEVTEKVDPTRTERDPVTGRERPKLLERRVKTTRLLPSASAVEWELERLAVDEDGARLFTPRQELTGSDGGPLEVEDRGARIARLAAEAEAYATGVSDGREREREVADSDLEDA